MAKAQATLDTQSAFGTRRAGFFQWLVWALSDWRPLGPALRRRLRKRFARPITGPFDVRHQGMALRLYPSENHCDRVIFGRRELPEQAEHDAILPLLKPNMVFVDIGANVGSYSVFAGNAAHKSAVLLAFEPHPRTYQKLLFNLQANGLPIHHVMNCGVGEREETLQLWSDGGSNIGHTSLLEEGTANAKVSVDVAVRPLLAVLAEHDITHIDVLKIDIEGFEDRALAPFLRAAPESLLPTHILMEMEHHALWEQDLEGLLAQLGYRARAVTPLNTLYSR